MAENEDIFEIDLNEEAKDDGKKKTAKKADEVVVETAKDDKKAAVEAPTTDEVVDKLKKKLADKETERVAAEKKAAEASQRAKKSENEVSTTQMQLVASAISTVEGESANLKASYKAALAAQDFDAAADIQEQMADARAKLLQLKNGKAAMEEEEKRRKERPERIEIDDPVEAVASTLTEPSAAWVRAHPEYVRNPRLNRKMIRAHEDALDDGIAWDTPEYFAYVEKALGLRKTQDDDEDDGVDPSKGENGTAMSSAAKPTQSRTSPPAAPVNNSGSATGRPGRRTLTRLQVEAAEASGLTPSEYWEHTEALRKAGRIN